MADLIDSQAAIDAICADWCANYQNCGYRASLHGEKFCDGCDDIEKLKQLPSAQLEVAKDMNVPSTDCISRQAAIDAINTWPKYGCNPDGRIVPWDDDKHYVPYVHYEDIVHALRHLPSTQPERMRGHWIEIQAPDSDGNGLYECSICHRGEVHVPIVEVPFCWHCGADMREGQDG